MRNVNKIFAIGTESMQPDEAVFRRVTSIQNDMGQDGSHVASLIIKVIGILLIPFIVIRLIFIRLVHRGGGAGSGGA